MIVPQSQTGIRRREIPDPCISAFYLYKDAVDLLHLPLRTDDGRSQAPQCFPNLMNAIFR